MTSPMCEAPSRLSLMERFPDTPVLGHQGSLVFSDPANAAPEEDYREILAHALAVETLDVDCGKSSLRVGEYAVGRRIGRGTFAEVRAAVHLGSKARVALKLVEKLWAVDEDRGRRHSSPASGGADESKEEQHVVREAAILRRLSNRSRGYGCRGGSHPNIVRSFDLVESDAYIGVALELVSGKTLSEFVSSYCACASGSKAARDARAKGGLSSSRWIERRIVTGQKQPVELSEGTGALAACDASPSAAAAHVCSGIPENLARRIARQVVSALQFMHGANIAHRDIKADNILILNENLEVKIIDFGCAAVFDERSRLKTRCGSASFMSPEMHAGTEYSGPEVDVWGCGVVVYFMLAGHLPFDAKECDLAALHANAAKDGYAIHLPRGVSEGAWGLLAAIFQHDPKKRATSRELSTHGWLATEGLDRASASLTARNRVVASRNSNARGVERRQRKRLAEACADGPNPEEAASERLTGGSSLPSLAKPLADDSSRAKKVAAWCDGDEDATDAQRAPASEDDSQKRGRDGGSRRPQALRVPAVHIHIDRTDNYDGDESADEDRDLNDLVSLRAARGRARRDARRHATPGRQGDFEGRDPSRPHVRLPSLCPDMTLPPVKRTRGERSPLGELARGTREALRSSRGREDSEGDDALGVGALGELQIPSSTSLPSTSRFLPPMKTLGYRRDR